MSKQGMEPNLLGSVGTPRFIHGVPFSIEVEITLSCPLKCRHCCARGGENEIELPQKSFERLVLSAKKMGVVTLDIIGGEPLARADIYELLSFATEHINVVLNTNGYLVDEKTVSKLLDTGLKYIFVSIDAPTFEKNSQIRDPRAFTKVCNAVKLLADAGFNVAISFVATSKNFSDIPRMVELARRLGATSIFVLRFIPVGRGEHVDFNLNKEMLRRLREDAEMEDFPIVFDCSFESDFGFASLDIMPRCPAGTVFACVTASGDVFPCGFLKYNHKFHCGNINERDFENLWAEGSGFSSLREAPHECLGCERYYECRGGCVALGRKPCDGRFNGL